MYIPKDLNSQIVIQICYADNPIVIDEEEMRHEFESQLSDCVRTADYLNSKQNGK